MGILLLGQKGVARIKQDCAHPGLSAHSEAPQNGDYYYYNSQIGIQASGWGEDRGELLFLSSKISRWLFKLGPE